MKKNMVKNLGFFLSIVIVITVSVCRAAELQPVRRPSLQSSSVTISQENYLQRALSSRQREELASMGRVLARNPSYASVQNEWIDFVSRFDGGGEPIDINAMLQFILRDSYSQIDKDIETYAEKVKYFNESKKKLREELAKARRQQSQPSIVTQPVERRSSAGELREISPPTTLPSAPPRMTSAASPTDAEILRLEAQLATVGNDEQLAKLALQKKLQMRQQALDTMSNVARQMYDAAMSIIKKIGG